MAASACEKGDFHTQIITPSATKKMKLPNIPHFLCVRPATLVQHLAALEPV